MSRLNDHKLSEALVGLFADLAARNDDRMARYVVVMLVVCALAMGLVVLGVVTGTIR